VGIAHFQNRKFLAGGTPVKDFKKIPDIECAVNDARTMRNLLVDKFGFNPSPDHIVFLANETATKVNIERALAELGDHNRIKETDRVLVYFSTHGQRIPLPDQSAEGFLIPYDAAINFGDINNPPQYRTSCLDMEYVGKMIEDCPARHRALIVDACYSGFSLNTKKLENLDGNLSPEQILKTLGARGFSILAASTTDQVAAGSTNPNGLSDYTRGLEDALLKVVSEGTTTVLQSVAATARAAVLERTKSRQDPGFVLRGGEGQFILFPIKPKPIPSADLGLLKFTSVPSGAADIAAALIGR
jgi:Caspase domain